MNQGKPTYQLRMNACCNDEQKVEKRADNFNKNKKTLKMKQDVGIADQQKSIETR